MRLTEKPSGRRALIMRNLWPASKPSNDLRSTIRLRDRHPVEDARLPGDSAGAFLRMPTSGKSSNNPPEFLTHSNPK